MSDEIQTNTTKQPGAAVLFIRLFFLGFLTYLIGYLSLQFATPDAMNWYDILRKSPLSPDLTLFAGAWFIAYSLMAIAAFLVWDDVSPRYFSLQLVLNGAWSFAFLYFRTPWAGAIILILMLCVLLYTIRQFFSASTAAGLLLFPAFFLGVYMLYLNGYIFFFNPIGMLAI